MYRVARKSADLPRMSLVTTAAMLAICMLALVETTNTAEAEDSLPQNGKIAFQSFTPESASNIEIYTMYPDGTGRVRLTYNPPRDEYPALSPDGTKIAFSATQLTSTPGVFEPAGIWVMDADGSDKTQLTNAGDYGPTWSPDGTKIAFTRDDRGQQDVWVMNADGTNQTKVTSPQHMDSLPTWSPDGTKIAFTRDSDIWTINADGSNPTQLTSTPGVFENEADWSPDGRYLAFESDHDGQTFDIYRMNADGSDVIRLTEHSVTENSVITYGQPSWSPDGTKIAFTWKGDLWTMNADGSSQTNLTADAPHPYEMAPDWGMHLQNETRVTTNSGVHDGNTDRQRSPRPTPPKSRSETVHPPDTGGPSLSLVASALLFSVGRLLYAVVQRRM